ncbi:3-hexulose-6-phosphate isomerase [uncultured Pleomorphomonas sp.]|uniref:6-phospho-3-hexuloisomerase n=2 Tax=Pleomorphomonas TaxID=261933 RepID=A0A2G9WXB6_9HYPH|nr:6-phospho-3-hexuloisomerase [Pleomorphomonas carboxyditropha]PIO99324.1 6-phospho-3-hexuloisomerase [Pleomorphomonas carboxyditropha]SCM78348.1 3-hexulose-6-phosphate isomerase [uncultured Pleomorphomonas sp.]
MNVADYGSAILEELRAVLSKVSPDEVSAFAGDLLAARRIFVAGAGRSGLAGRAFAMRLMHFGLDAFVIGEIATPAYSGDDLLVVCSGSGETGSLVSIADKARRIGGKIALVTIVPDSTIGKLADRRLVLPAPSPKAKAGDGVRSIQPMGSLFEQALLLLLDAVILELMARRGATSDGMFTRHANLE